MEIEQLAPPYCLYWCPKWGFDADRIYAGYSNMILICRHAVEMKHLVHACNVRAIINPQIQCNAITFGSCIDKIIIKEE